MRCVVLVMLILGLTAPARPFGEDGPDRPLSVAANAGVPDATIPYSLRDFWLRFHETELCQEIHVEFVFHRNGFEAWCRTEDEKAYQRFTGMLEPLRSSYQIDLHIAEGPKGKVRFDGDNLPPSLWNNEELRQYFQYEPAHAATSGLYFEKDVDKDEPIALKQRLAIFGQQTLDWNGKMRRFGEELPMLAGAAVDPSAALDTRSRAIALCLAHTRALAKLAEKLYQNIRTSLPKTSGHRKLSSGSEKSVKKEDPIRGAVAISITSKNIAQRIYLYINPQNHAVAVSDLRDPSLLESIKSLQNMLAVFQQALSQHREFRR